MDNQHTLEAPEVVISGNTSFSRIRDLYTTKNNLKGLEAGRDIPGHQRDWPTVLGRTICRLSRGEQQDARGDHCVGLSLSGERSSGIFDGKYGGRRDPTPGALTEPGVNGKGGSTVRILL